MPAELKQTHERHFSMPKRPANILSCAFIVRSAYSTTNPPHFKSFAAIKSIAITFVNNSKSRLPAHNTYTCTFVCVCVCVFLHYCFSIARACCCFASTLAAWSLCCIIKCLKCASWPLSAPPLPPLTHYGHAFAISSLLHSKLPLISLLLPLLLAFRIIATHTEPGRMNKHE